jgi:hypothetical protein
MDEIHTERRVASVHSIFVASVTPTGLRKRLDGQLMTACHCPTSDAGQIIVVGDINTTLKENILAVTGGTRAFINGSGQVARRVLPRSEFVFSDTLSEVEYIFQRSNW